MPGRCPPEVLQAVERGDDAGCAGLRHLLTSRNVLRELHPNTARVEVLSAALEHPHWPTFHLLAVESGIVVEPDINPNGLLAKAIWQDQLLEGSQFTRSFLTAWDASRAQANRLSVPVLRERLARRLLDSKSSKPADFAQVEKRALEIATVQGATAVVGYLCDRLRLTPSEANLCRLQAAIQRACGQGRQLVSAAADAGSEANYRAATRRAFAAIPGFMGVSLPGWDQVYDSLSAENRSIEFFLTSVFPCRVRPVFMSGRDGPNPTYSVLYQTASSSWRAWLPSVEPAMRLLAKNPSAAGRVMAAVDPVHLGLCANDPAARSFVALNLIPLAVLMDPQARFSAAQLQQALRQAAAAIALNGYAQQNPDQRSTEYGNVLLAEVNRDLGRPFYGTFSDGSHVPYAQTVSAELHHAQCTRQIRPLLDGQRDDHVYAILANAAIPQDAQAGALITFGHAEATAAVHEWLWQIAVVADPDRGQRPGLEARLGKDVLDKLWFTYRGQDTRVRDVIDESCMPQARAQEFPGRVIQAVMKKFEHDLNQAKREVTQTMLRWATQGQPMIYWHIPRPEPAAVPAPAAVPRLGPVAAGSTLVAGGGPRRCPEVAEGRAANARQMHPCPGAGPRLLSAPPPRVTTALPARPPQTAEMPSFMLRQPFPPRPYQAPVPVPYGVMARVGQRPLPGGLAPPTRPTAVPPRPHPSPYAGGIYTHRGCVPPAQEPFIQFPLVVCW